MPKLKLSPDKVQLDPLTILKTIGGKSLVTLGNDEKVIERIEKLYNKELELNPDIEFVDLFAGGLSIEFFIQPKKCWINDLNSHLINFYEFIKSDGFITDIEADNTEEIYYKNRTLFNQVSADPFLTLEEINSLSAQLFYYLNRTGFNGLCRFNKKGEFNTPWGRYKYSNVKTDLTQYQQLLAQWEITNYDWNDCINEVKLNQNNMFLISDSPYENTFDSYTQKGFDNNEHRKLIKFLSELSCPIVAFNSWSQELEDEYRSHGFDIDYCYREDKVNRKRGLDSKVKELFCTKGMRG